MLTPHLSVSVWGPSPRGGNSCAVVTGLGLSDSPGCQKPRGQAKHREGTLTEAPHPESHQSHEWVDSWPRESRGRVRVCWAGGPAHVRAKEQAVFGVPRAGYGSGTHPCAIVAGGPLPVAQGTTPPCSPPADRQIDVHRGRSPGEPAGRARGRAWLGVAQMAVIWGRASSQGWTSEFGGLKRLP